MRREKDTTTLLTKKTWKTKLFAHRFIFISFFLPFLLLGIGFAIYKVYPFGDQQILVTDFWQQYFPFMCDFQEKLKEGSSLLYSWGTGLGTNYIALIAYYLASPLNLLFVFVPSEFLREFVTLSLLIKVGCAGSFFAILLRFLFKRNDFSIVFFSALYALCAFTMGYYWNIIWFDTFALLPLLVLGTVALVTRGKYKLFVIALALSMLTNYYIGFFSCIFVVIVFIGICLFMKTPIKVFFKKLLQIAGFALLGVGISALLILPAYIALQHTFKSLNAAIPEITTLYSANYTDALTYATDILAGFNAFTKPTDKDGLPNISCGFICVLLAAFFFRSRKVSFREKIFNTVVLLFLVYCCIYKLPNYIIHGMHLPNQLPYRFSFIISFIVILMAYRAFLLLKDIKLMDILTMALTGGVFILFAVVSKSDQHTDLAIKGTIALGVAYVALLLLNYLKIMPHKAMVVGIYALILVELCGSVFVGVDTVRTTTHDNYPDKYQEIRTLMDNIDEKDDSLFYREGQQMWYTVNDPAIYGYKGAACFSSTVNGSVTTYVEGLGLPSWDIGNRYQFAETSPLTHAFLDIKYIVGRRTEAKDMNNWEQIEEYKFSRSYKNTRYLSLGFMAENELKDFDYKETVMGISARSPFDAQQNLFAKSTGVYEELFTQITPTEEVEHTGATVSQTDTSYSYTLTNGTSGTLKWNYKMPKTGAVYIYTDIYNGKNINVTNGNTLTTESYEVDRPYIVSAGEFQSGQTLSLSCDVSGASAGTARVYVCVLNQDVFDKGYDQLKDELYQVESFDTTKISGTIQAKKDGIMYTSIPYEKGWTAYVDGVKTDIVPIAEAMCGLSLTAGSHTVEFKYIPEGFVPGAVICVASILIFAAIILLDRFKKKKGMVLFEGYSIDLLEAENTEDKEDDPMTNRNNGKKKRKRR